ncbi:hypothetical protein T4D_6355 [Trichinella pseudospiralis]|uniref:Uncharacterized protein n=1 Tax=Trichinella pseudospiralis TaxID=6337 RepID=A0A0V1F984_TRIPS|nr:hypothetical protein T4D_6355 [Trichinella pseudospiralis]
MAHLDLLKCCCAASLQFSENEANTDDEAKLLQKRYRSQEKQAKQCKAKHKTKQNFQQQQQQQQRKKKNRCAVVLPRNYFFTTSIWQATVSKSQPLTLIKNPNWKINYLRNILPEQEAHFRCLVLHLLSFRILPEGNILLCIVVFMITP